MVYQDIDYCLSSKEIGEYPKTALVDTYHFRTVGTVSLWRKWDYANEYLISVGYRIALPECMITIGTLHHPYISVHTVVYENYTRPWGSHSKIIEVIL